MAAHFDRRLIPARPDLAAAHLKGRVEAERFVEGEIREVRDAQAPLRREPRPDATLDTEALKGERVAVYDSDGEGWCWCQLQTDGYVGWIPANALAAPGPEPTHRIAVPRTLVFPGPDIKLPPVDALPFGARIAVMRSEGRFAVFAGGCIAAGHIVPVSTKHNDPVSVAERFLGVPYLWGGKTSYGLDCSGLVQVSLQACGVESLRDSDMQERSLGAQVAGGEDFSHIRRGDLIFWKGHVAIARDGGSILHANAFHMMVAAEPLQEAVRRIAADGSQVTSVRRLVP